MTTAPSTDTLLCEISSFSKDIFDLIASEIFAIA